MPRDATAPSDVPASTRTSRTGPDLDAIERKLDLLDATAGSSADSREPTPDRSDGAITTSNAAERKAALLDKAPGASREIPSARPELDTPAARKAALLDRAADARAAVTASTNASSRPAESLDPTIDHDRPVERRSPDSPNAPKASADKPGTERVELNDKLGAIYRASLTTPAGRAFFETDDHELRGSALSARPKDGFYTADLHGSPRNFKVGEERLDASELASLIRSDERWQERPVRLISCSTGAGENPVAKKLANELVVKVEAPTGSVWVDRTGETVVDDVRTRNRFGFAVRKPGEWITFAPEGKGQHDAP